MDAFDLCFVPDADDAAIEAHFLGGADGTISSHNNTSSTSAGNSSRNASNFDLGKLMNYYHQNSAALSKVKKDEKVDKQAGGEKMALGGLGSGRKVKEEEAAKRGGNSTMGGFGSGNTDEAGNNSSGKAIGALQKKLKRMKRRQEEHGEVYEDDRRRFMDESEGEGEVKKVKDLVAEGNQEDKMEDGEGGENGTSENVNEGVIAEGEVTIQNHAKKNVIKNVHQMKGNGNSGGGGAKKGGVQSLEEIMRQRKEEGGNKKKKRRKR